MPLRLSDATRNAFVNAAKSLIDAGAGAGAALIYTGSQPATPATAATGTLLATVTLPKPSLPAAASGTAAFNDPAAVTAAATGTAGWVRVTDSTGAVVFDGDVTATGGGGVLTLVSTSVTAGQSIDITGGSLTQPM